MMVIQDELPFETPKPMLDDLIKIYEESQDPQEDGDNNETKS
jgi:hypothetical protein